MPDDDSLLVKANDWYQRRQLLFTLLAIVLIGSGWQIVQPIHRFEKIEARLTELERARELAETQATLTCLTSPDVRALVLSRMPCARLLRDIETPEAERRRRELLTGGRP